jgi:GYF domain 2
MYKIIGADGKEYGPVSAEQLRQWIAEGRVNAQTQVQAEGDAEWKPLGQIAEFSNLPSPLAKQPAPSGVLPPPLAGTPAVLDIGGCISRSWTLLKGHPGSIIGATVLVLFALFAVGIVLRLGANLATGVTLRDITQARGLDRFRLQWPGLLASNVWFLIMTGPMVGGLYNFYLKLIRGQPADIGDAFAGFGAPFGQLALGYFVMYILIIVGFLCCLIPGFYLSVAWKFMLPAIIDKHVGFWEAMELSRKTVTGRWWLVFALALLTGLLAAAGLLACCIGVFVTAPIGIGAIMYAYEDLIGIQVPASR